MVEIINGKTIITTPILASDLRDIHIGDIVYLSGKMTTCCDVAHHRVVEEGLEIPIDLNGDTICQAYYKIYRRR